MSGLWDEAADISALGGSFVVDAQTERARRHAPILLLDKVEPYQPLVFGYSVFDRAGQSPSSKFEIVPKGAITIEYAIWYDWDIQHLYDLEHVWVHLDAADKIICVEASRHGGRHELPALADGLTADGAQAIIYVEPGKHAHWPTAAQMWNEAGVNISAMCQAFAGRDGIHLTNSFGADGRIFATGFDQRLAKLKMKRDRFLPTFDFTPALHDEIAIVPWTSLDAWVPARVGALISNLKFTVPHLEALFLDCGDTLVDESTEKKCTGSEIVLGADLFPAAGEVLRQLSLDGYRLALVADGPRETFENVLKHHGLWHCFDAHVISGDVGELKPSQKMFSTAADALSLTKSDIARSLMIGNNLQRDMRGANLFGLISVFIAWSKRRTHAPEIAEDKPDFKINYIWEFCALLEQIELSLPFDAVLQRNDK